jgi:hypothetical protein
MGCGETLSGSSWFTLACRNSQLNLKNHPDKLLAKDKRKK